MSRRKAAPPAESPEKKNPAPKAAETPEISAPPAPAAPAAPEPVPESRSPKETETASTAPPEPAAPAATETVPESGPPKETASPAPPGEPAEPPPAVREDTPVLEQPAGPQDPPEAAKPLAPDGRPALVISPKGLNLRAGPAFSFDVLSVLDSGTLVLILDLPGGAKVPGWALIGAGELAGWVSDRFLRPLTE